MTHLVSIIKEILDSAGDGSRARLDGPRSVAVDTADNVFVPGYFTHNVLKVSPDGIISEIIDGTGDGAGNTLGYPSSVAVDNFENVIVTGYDTDNAFSISPDGIITEIIDGSGDGAGNILDGPLAVIASEHIYVTGYVVRGVGVTPSLKAPGSF